MLRVHCAGDWGGLEGLRAALLREPSVEAADAHAADVVLLATIEAELPAHDLAAVRAQTEAPVVLLAVTPTEELLDACEAAGIAELASIQPAEGLALVLRRVARAVHNGGGCRVVTVFSPKGGTGKSVTACNLAAAAAERGLRTLLLDLDLQFGDIAIMFGLEPRKTLHDVVVDGGTLDTEKLAGYVTAGAAGVDVLPAPLRPEDAEQVSEERIVHLLDVARRAYDVVVVDTSPYFHGPMLATLERTDTLVLVAAPDVPTLKNLRLTLHTLGLLGFPAQRTRILLNRADPRVGLRPGEVGAVLEHSIDFQLPNDPAVQSATNRGVPVLAAEPRSPYARAFTPVADELLDGVASAEPRRRRIPFSLGRS
jgi:pilus assembly protein CpaE